MSLIHQYIFEFNKLVSSINFLSSSNDVTLKNKLFLIQQDISDSVDFDSIECYNFFSNIYNILSQSSDPKSPLVTNCIDVLQKAVHSRNKAIKKIVQDINFLPAITKLLWFVNEENFSDNIIKLLILIKNLIIFNNELDEHNMKVFITSLRDFIENFNNEKITKLSLHILANLAMQNDSAKYLISRSIKTTEVQEKINKSSDLIAMKFLIIIMGEFLPKDFPHLIKLSLKTIKESISSFDSEPIIHSIDMLKYAKQICSDGRCNISEMESIISLFEDLNVKLKIQFNDEKSNELKKEMLDNIFDYYSQLLEFDNKLAHFLGKFTSEIFENSIFTRSASGLKFFSHFINLGGSFPSMDNTIESIIEFFNNNANANPQVITNSQKYEFLKFLKVLHHNEKLDNTHYKVASKFMENILQIFEDFKIENIDDNIILLLVYSLQTLYAVSQDSSLFKDCLDKILDSNAVPCILAKAYMLRKEEIFQILFSLTPLEKFPNDKVAKLLAQNVYWNFEKKSQREVKNRFDTSTASKYITSHLLHELDDLIKRINQKLDSDIDGIKTSDIISLYRQKNNYLQDHLTTVTESLNKYSDLYNEMQQQNCILRKLGEKQEVINWCLQLDKEKLVTENKKLETFNNQLGSSIATFRSKIEKEITNNFQMQKQLTIKDIEIEKLRSEKTSMESEKQKFRQAQKENELRIQQLKHSLEEEKRLREIEVSSALTEQKRIAQNAEKEHAKFQEVIKINENDLVQKQQRITELEAELKEAEKIHMSIMSIMQKSKNMK